MTEIKKPEMKKAIWLSRHKPTERQLAEMADMGYELVALEQGMALGAKELQDWGDLTAFTDAITALVKKLDADAIFGVAPVPLMFYMHCHPSGSKGLPFWSSWNVKRSKEGGLPTFEHHVWVKIGNFWLTE